MLDRADDFTAGGAHGFGRLVFKRRTECIIDCDEEPGVEPFVDKRLRDAGSIRIIVVCPLEACRRAGFAGQIHGRRGRIDRHLFLRTGDLLDGKRHPGIREVDHHVYAIDVEPFARDLASNIGLVLVISRKNADGTAQNGASGLLCRNASGLNRARTT